MYYFIGNAFSWGWIFRSDRALVAAILVFFRLVPNVVQGVLVLVLQSFISGLGLLGCCLLAGPFGLISHSLYLF